MEEILSNYTQQAHDFYNRKDKHSDFDMSLKIEQEEFKGLVQSIVKNDEFPSPQACFTDDDYKQPCVLPVTPKPIAYSES